VKPANATGDLQSFNIFTMPNGTPRDPNRPGYDPTGWIQNVLLARMPFPNDFTSAASTATIPVDGLNLAGYRWTRRINGFDLNDGNDTIPTAISSTCASTAALSSVTETRSVSQKASMRSKPAGNGDTATPTAAMK